MTAPAEPILASTLWNAHLLTIDSFRGSKPSRIATGHRELDNGLEGGLDYGNIVCISAEPNSGVQNLVHALLVSHLLGSGIATATVIDSTLAFNVRKLHQTLGEAAVARGEDAGMAMKALERVKLMKVFDFVGLTEAIAELRQGLDGGNTAELAAPEVIPAPRGTVGDSDGEEDEMLDVPSPPQESAPVTRTPIVESSGGLLIIDNIAQATAPLLKSNHVQGQAMLVSFMRSLSHLTRSYNLCTILLNATTTYTQAKEEPPSIFSSCTLRPALGKTFTYLLDVHLLVHLVPKGAEDAEAVYGDGKRERNVEMVNVVEVLQDRCSGRVGSWAAFAVDDRGRLTDIE